MDVSFGFDRLGVPLARFTSWWSGELRAMLPKALATMARRRARRLVLSMERGSFTLLEESHTACTVLEEARQGDKDALDRLAARTRRAIGHRRGPIGLRLARSDCFVRELTLPAAARHRLAAVLAVDLQRTLPPSATDVVWSWIAEAHPDLPGKLRVVHIVVKRALLQAALAELAEAGIVPDFADCWRDGSSAFDVDLIAERESRGASRLKRAWSALLLAAALLGCAAPLIAFNRQQEALAALETQVERSKAEALVVRAEVQRGEGKLSAAATILDRRRGRPLAIEVWQEITRLLPDDAFAEELAIEGDSLSLAGKARAAAALVTAFEASTFLAEAGLASSVVFDPETGLERFNISARIVRAPGAADTPRPIAAEGAGDLP